MIKKKKKPQKEQKEKYVSRQLSGSAILSRNRWAKKILVKLTQILKSTV